VAAGSFDIEQAIALEPDVLILNYEAESASRDAQLVEKLGRAGIEVVYVDFRHSPFRNTDPSLRLLGQLFGRQEKAESLIASRNEQIARVTRPIAATPNLRRPLVMVDRVPGTARLVAPLTDPAAALMPYLEGRGIVVVSGKWASPHAARRQLNAKQIANSVRR
jgi:ABC-type Fe3+-hydroxamate transport system substrate-binding protein